MVKTALDDGAPVAPFLMKCYEMVDDPSTDNVISWSTDAHSFAISDVAELQAHLLPKYFKHGNFSSFIRQLNIYGFRKIDSDKWIFANDGFIKGQKNLLKNIPRRKQSQAIIHQKTQLQQQKEDDAIRASEKEQKLNGLWSEVECLKADKNSLTQELAKLRLHQENSHTKLAILREQIKGMEKDQQQMLSFIVMAMQNPAFLVHILQPKEPNWRRAEASKGVFNRVIDDDLDENSPSGEGVIVTYKPPVIESPIDMEASEGGLDNLMDINFPNEDMDENLFVSETSGPIVIQDQFDDYSALERFLLSSPLREDMENSDFDSGEIETEDQNSKMSSLASGPMLQGDQKLEILTERMGNLASECNIKQ